MKPPIVLSNLSFGYDDIPILEDVNLQISLGSFTGVIGPNGGGKTTFLKLLMGFLKPSKGSIKIFGQSPSEAKTQIGYVPQLHRTDLDFPISVLEVTLLGALSKLSFWGKFSKEVKAKAEFLLEEMGLGDYLNKPFRSLSGGLAQKVLLARALLSDPNILLLDEPTANIDAPSVAFIIEKLSQYKGHKTILFVTHDLKTIGEKVDRFICIQNQITSYLPHEICEHFALGLYHSPLLKMPEKPPKKGQSRELSPR